MEVWFIPLKDGLGRQPSLPPGFEPQCKWRSFKLAATEMQRRFGKKTDRQLMWFPCSRQEAIKSIVCAAITIRSRDNCSMERLAAGPRRHNSLLDDKITHINDVQEMSQSTQQRYLLFDQSKSH
jgi:hypothetical protein